MNKQILRLAIPNIISNLSVPLLGIVDTAVIGHLNEIYYLGALAVGSTIFNFIFWGFGFLRMGTTGLTAQAYGANDKVSLIGILYRVQFMAIIISVILIALQTMILDVSFKLIESSMEVELYARTYYKIRIYAAPATLALYGLNGWFLGMQNARIPMYLTILLNFLNILLNLYFVVVLDLNVTGVAYGTLISSYITLLAGFGFLLYHYKDYLIRVSKELLLQLSAYKKLFEVNADIFIRTVCLIFSFTFFTAVSSSFGDLTLAANTILLQFWMIASYGIDGFAYSAESLVGKYIGAGDSDSLKKAVKYTMIWGISLGLLGSLIYLLFNNQMLNIFTDKEQVIITAKSFIIWTILAPVVSSVCYVWDGVFIGATSTASMRNSMLIATILVFLPTYYLGRLINAEHAIWAALLLFMISRGLVLTFLSRKSIFSLIQESTSS